MKSLTAAVVIALVHSSLAALLIKGPSTPVMEGGPVTLECLLQDSEYNISNVRFEAYNSFRESWYGVRESWRSGWCTYREKVVTRYEDRATLFIPFAYSSHNTYRCVIDGTNTTDPELVSEPLNFTVHYVTGPQLTRDGYNRYFSFPQTLSVRAGTDVEVNCSASSSDKIDIYWYKEGSDWILPNPVLTLEKVSEFSEGQYTCSVVHPTIPSLTRTRSFNLTVLSESAAWLQTSDGWIFISTLVSVSTCMLVMVFVSVFLCRRAKKLRTSKGPIDDRSQKKPIYKSSAESVAVTCGDDKQPLV